MRIQGFWCKYQSVFKVLRVNISAYLKFYV